MNHEKLYTPVEEAWHYSSQPITIEKFKTNCCSKINTADRQPLHQPTMESVKELASELEIDEETARDLQMVCDVSNLQCEYDVQFDYNTFKIYERFPDDGELKTVRLCKDLKTKAEELFFIPTYIEPPDEDFSVDEDQIQDDEVIVCCTVMHPKQKKNKRNLQTLLIGDTKLSELRDLIKCQMDRVVFQDMSENPDQLPDEDAQKLFPSSFFFIERTFYNDTRDPAHHDISKTIVEWAKHSDRYNMAGLGLLHSDVMETTCIKDIEIRLGYPYLFCHQGSCEHLILFTDMRLRQDSDPKLKKSYPYVSSDAQRRRKRCSICCIHLAKWVTINDELSFETPGLFCDKCFRYLHYDKDGRKISRFQAYPHIPED
eukprot:TCONS_00006173-protein